MDNYVSVLETVWYDSAICRQGKKCKKHGGFLTEVSDMARNMKMELLTFSLIQSFPRNLGQTTSYKTEVQEREPWVFYEWITCNEKPRKTQMRSEYFSRNVLAGNINRWKNITADGLFRKDGTTTIWIWKHWNNMILNFSVTHVPFLHFRLIWCSLT
jgi:hypothetical protein